MGGDPKTVQEALWSDRGGDPKTDHSSFVEETDKCDEMAATFPPYRPGGLATQTAITESVPVSPALHTDSNDHSHGCAVPDGLPSESPVHADGLPSSAVSESSSLLDRIFQKKIQYWYFTGFSHW